MKEAIIGETDDEVRRWARTRVSLLLAGNPTTSDIDVAAELTLWTEAYSSYLDTDQRAATRRAREIAIQRLAPMQRAALYSRAEIMVKELGHTWDLPPTTMALVAAAVKRRAPLARTAPRISNPTAPTVEAVLLVKNAPAERAAPWRLFIDMITGLFRRSSPASQAKMAFHAPAAKRAIESRIIALAEIGDREALDQIDRLVASEKDPIQRESAKALVRRINALDLRIRRLGRANDADSMASASERIETILEKNPDLRAALSYRASLVREDLSNRIAASNLRP